MKKTVLKILGIMVVLILLMQNSFTLALTEQERLEKEKNQNEQKYNQEKEKNDQQIDEAKQKQKELEAKKSATLKTVESLIGQISNSEEEIDNLQEKSNSLQEQITSKEKDIEKKQEEYNEQEKLLDARVIAVYENGDNAYLEALLTSSSITDFLAKYFYASELVEYDKELIEQIKAQKIQIEREKTELEEDKKELNTTLVQKEAKNVQLKDLKKEKEIYAKQLSAEEQQLQKEIEELQAANRQIQKDINSAREKYKKQLEELKKQEANNNNSSGGSSGSSGYLARPVASGSITAKAYYSTGKFHGALDYGVSPGTKVMAAADGVVMSTANLSGSYGTYVVIEHANGLQTYYAHGTYGSIVVKPGDIVKRGQKIMLSGNTGNSSGPHLHFEVRKSPYNYNHSAKAYGDDSRVDPLKYM